MENNRIGQYTMGQYTMERYRQLYYYKNNYSKIIQGFYKILIYHKLSYRWLKLNSAFIKKEHVKKIYNNSYNRYYNYQNLLLIKHKLQSDIYNTVKSYL
jgi:hypothetical protein